MSFPNRRQMLIYGCAFGFGSAPALAQEAAPPRLLVFGLIAPRSAEQIRENWRPFVERMGQALRLPIDIKVFAEQGELVQSFRKGAIDLAWLGNAPALDVVESGAGAVFAQLVTKEGSTGYRSILIVPKASTLTDLASVIRRGPQLSFGDGDLKSTSGHLVPYYFAFQKSGINDTRALFKSVSNGSHQQNLTMTAKGEIDVATANTEELLLFRRDFPELARELRVIWESPVIPQSPLLWKTALPLSLRQRILQFTVGFGGTDKEQLRILDGMNNLSGFRQSNNLQLVSVADIEMFKARQAINNNKQLSPADRAKRIDEVIRRGSRLDLRIKFSVTPER